MGRIEKKARAHDVSPRMRAIIEQILRYQKPRKFTDIPSELPRFVWTFGKGDFTHWVDVFNAFDLFLEASTTTATTAIFGSDDRKLAREDDLVDANAGTNATTNSFAATANTTTTASESALKQKRMKFESEPNFISVKDACNFVLECAYLVKSIEDETKMKESFATRAVSKIQVLEDWSVEVEREEKVEKNDDDDGGCYARQKKTLLWILRCTRAILDECWNKHEYFSTEHLARLLHHEDFEIAYEALLTIHSVAKKTPGTRVNRFVPCNGLTQRLITLSRAEEIDVKANSEFDSLFFKFFGLFCTVDNLAMLFECAKRNPNIEEVKNPSSEVEAFIKSKFTVVEEGFNKRTKLQDDMFEELWKLRWSSFNKFFESSRTTKGVQESVANLAMTTLLQFSDSAEDLSYDSKYNPTKTPITPAEMRRLVFQTSNVQEKASEIVRQLDERLSINTNNVPSTSTSKYYLRSLCNDASVAAWALSALVNERDTCSATLDVLRAHKSATTIENLLSISVDWLRDAQYLTKKYFDVKGRMSIEEITMNKGEEEANRRELASYLYFDVSDHGNIEASALAEAAFALLANLSTSPPGCHVLRDANALEPLFKLFKHERADHIPFVAIFAHSLEMILDYNRDANRTFRERGGVLLLCERLRKEIETSLTEYEETCDSLKSIDVLMKLSSGVAAVKPPSKDSNNEALTTNTTPGSASKRKKVQEQEVSRDNESEEGTPSQKQKRESDINEEIPPTGATTTMSSETDMKEDTNAIVLPSYVSYSRRVLIKALTRALAFAIFGPSVPQDTHAVGLDGPSGLNEAICLVFDNAKKFGGSGVTTFASLVTDYLNHDPTCYVKLENAGVFDALFRAFENEDIANNSKVLCVAPQVISAACLHEDGRKKVIERGILSNVMYPAFTKQNYQKALSAPDIASAIGSNVDELLRHVPQLRQHGVEMLYKIFDEILRMCTKTDSEDGNENFKSIIPESKERSERESQEKALQGHVMYATRLLEGIIQTNELVARFLSYKPESTGLETEETPIYCGIEILTRIFVANKLPSSFHSSTAGNEFLRVLRTLSSIDPESFSAAFDLALGSALKDFEVKNDLWVRNISECERFCRDDRYEAEKKNYFVHEMGNVCKRLEHATNFLTNVIRMDPGALGTFYQKIIDLCRIYESMLVSIRWLNECGLTTPEEVDTHASYERLKSAIVSAFVAVARPPPATWSRNGRARVNIYERTQWTTIAAVLLQMEDTIYTRYQGILEEIQKLSNPSLRDENWLPQHVYFNTLRDVKENGFEISNLLTQITDFIKLVSSILGYSSDRRDKTRRAFAPAIILGRKYGIIDLISRAILPAIIKCKKLLCDENSEAQMKLTAAHSKVPPPRNDYEVEISQFKKLRDDIFHTSIERADGCITAITSFFEKLSNLEAFPTMMDRSHYSLATIPLLAEWEKILELLGSLGDESEGSVAAAKSKLNKGKSEEEKLEASQEIDFGNPEQADYWVKEFETRMMRDGWNIRGRFHRSTYTSDEIFQRLGKVKMPKDLGISLHEECFHVATLIQESISSDKKGLETDSSFKDGFSKDVLKSVFRIMARCFRGLNGGSAFYERGLCDNDRFSNLKKSTAEEVTDARNDKVDIDPETLELIVEMGFSAESAILAQSTLNEHHPGKRFNAEAITEFLLSHPEIIEKAKKDSDDAKVSQAQNEVAETKNTPIEEDSKNCAHLLLVPLEERMKERVPSLVGSLWEMLLCKNNEVIDNTLLFEFIEIVCDVIIQDVNEVKVNDAYRMAVVETIMKSRTVINIPTADKTAEFLVDCMTQNVSKNYSENKETESMHTMQDRMIGLRQHATVLLCLRDSKFREIFQTMKGSAVDDYVRLLEVFAKFAHVTLPSANEVNVISASPLCRFHYTLQTVILVLHMFAQWMPIGNGGSFSLNGSCDNAAFSREIDIIAGRPFGIVSKANQKSIIESLDVVLRFFAWAQSPAVYEKQMYSAPSVDPDSEWGKVVSTCSRSGKRLHEIDFPLVYESEVREYPTVVDVLNNSTECFDSSYLECGDILKQSKYCDRYRFTDFSNSDSAIDATRCPLTRKMLHEIRQPVRLKGKTYEKSALMQKYGLWCSLCGNTSHIDCESVYPKEIQKDEHNLGFKTPDGEYHDPKDVVYALEQQDIFAANFKAKFYGKSPKDNNPGSFAPQIQAAMTLLEHFTKSHENTMIWLNNIKRKDNTSKLFLSKMWGCDMLLQLRTLPQHSFVAFTNLLASIFRHVAEDPNTLHYAMEREIRKSLESAFHSSKGGVVSASVFLTVMSPVMARDVHTFFSALEKCAFCIQAPDPKSKNEDALLIILPRFSISEEKKDDRNEKKGVALDNKVTSTSHATDKKNRKDKADVEIPPPSKSFIQLIRTLLKIIKGNTVADLKLAFADGPVPARRDPPYFNVHNRYEEPYGASTNVHAIAEVKFALRLLSELIEVHAAAGTVLVELDKNDASVGGVLNHVFCRLLTKEKTTWIESESEYNMPPSKPEQIPSGLAGYKNNKFPSWQGAERAAHFLATCAIRVQGCREFFFSLVARLLQNDFSPIKDSYSSDLSKYISKQTNKTHELYVGHLRAALDLLTTLVTHCVPSRSSVATKDSSASIQNGETLAAMHRHRILPLLLKSLEYHCINEVRDGGRVDLGILDAIVAAIDKLSSAYEKMSKEISPAEAGLEATEVRERHRHIEQSLAAVIDAVLRGDSDDDEEEEEVAAMNADEEAMMEEMADLEEEDGNAADFAEAWGYSDEEDDEDDDDDIEEGFEVGSDSDASRDLIDGGDSEDDDDQEHHPDDHSDDELDAEDEREMEIMMERGMINEFEREEREDMDAAQFPEPEDSEDDSEGDVDDGYTDDEEEEEDEMTEEDEEGDFELPNVDDVDNHAHTPASTRAENFTRNETRGRNAAGGGYFLPHGNLPHVSDAVFNVRHRQVNQVPGSRANARLHSEAHDEELFDMEPDEDEMDEMLDGEFVPNTSAPGGGDGEEEWEMDDLFEGEDGDQPPPAPPAPSMQLQSNQVVSGILNRVFARNPQPTRPENPFHPINVFELSVDDLRRLASGELPRQDRVPFLDQLERQDRNSGSGYAMNRREASDLRRHQLNRRDGSNLTNHSTMRHHGMHFGEGYTCESEDAHGCGISRRHLPTRRVFPDAHPLLIRDARPDERYTLETRCSVDVCSSSGPPVQLPSTRQVSDLITELNNSQVRSIAVDIINHIHIDYGTTQDPRVISSFDGREYYQQSHLRVGFEQRPSIPSVPIADAAPGITHLTRPVLVQMSGDLARLASSGNPMLQGSTSSADHLDLLTFDPYGDPLHINGDFTTSLTRNQILSPAAGGASLSERNQMDMSRINVDRDGSGNDIISMNGVFIYRGIIILNGDIDQDALGDTAISPESAWDLCGLRARRHAWTDSARSMLGTGSTALAPNAPLTICERNKVSSTISGILHGLTTEGFRSSEQQNSDDEQKIHSPTKIGKVSAKVLEKQSEPKDDDGNSSKHKSVIIDEEEKDNTTDLAVFDDDASWIPEAAEKLAREASDQASLNALPDTIRKELLHYNAIVRRLNDNPPKDLHQTQNFDEIDATFLAALPPDIQKEALAQSKSILDSARASMLENRKKAMESKKLALERSEKEKSDKLLHDKNEEKWSHSKNALEMAAKKMKIAAIRIEMPDLNKEEAQCLLMCENLSRVYQNESYQRALLNLSTFDLCRDTFLIGLWSMIDPVLSPDDIICVNMDKFVFEHNEARARRALVTMHWLTQQHTKIGGRLPSIAAMSGDDAAVTVFERILESLSSPVALKHPGSMLVYQLMILNESFRASKMSKIKRSGAKQQLDKTDEASATFEDLKPHQLEPLAKLLDAYSVIDQGRFGNTVLSHAQTLMRHFATASQKQAGVLTVALLKQAKRSKEFAELHLNSCSSGVVDTHMLHAGCASILRIVRALAQLKKERCAKVEAVEDKKNAHTVGENALLELSEAMKPTWKALSVAAHKVEPLVTPHKPGAAPPPAPLTITAMLPAVEAFFALADALAPEQLDEVSKKMAEKQETRAMTTTVTPIKMSQPSRAATPGLLRASSVKPTSMLGLDALLENTSVNIADELKSRLSTEAWKFAERHRGVINALLRRNPQLLSTSLKTLLRTPTLVDFDVKRAHIQIKIRKEKEKYASRGISKLKIRRSHLLEDSYNQVRARTQEEMKSRMQIVFVGEEGVDAGGLTREWYQILVQQIFNPDWGLFQLAPSGEACYEPNKNSSINPEHLSYFRFAGRLVGKALYDGVLLDAYFTRPIYKHLLGQPLTFEDMEGVDPDYYKNLKWMLDNDIEGVLDLNFSDTQNFFGETETVDLIKNGRNVSVTNVNKLDYVNLITAHRMTDAVKDQLEAFIEGFTKVLDRDFISVLNAGELELLISGTPDIDLDDLKANTEYHGYTMSSPQIRWFWEIVREMNLEDRARLLMFCTGTSKVPLDGFAKLRGMSGFQKFQIHKAQLNDPNQLCTAHTCFNQLDLIAYDTKEELQERLLYSIREGSQGFGFA